MIPNKDASTSYTRIPNSVLEWLLGPEHDLSFRQVRVLLTVFRFTYGFSRRSAPLSTSFIETFTGIDRANVCRALKSLVDSGLLTVTFQRKIGYYTLVPRAYKNKKKHVVEYADAADLAHCCQIDSDDAADLTPKIKRKQKVKTAEELWDGTLPAQEPCREFTAEEMELLGGPAPVEQPEPAPVHDLFSELW